jgi:hypothetical protein
VLAEIFVDLGVPHVVCFDFSEEFQRPVYSQDCDHVYDAMYEFCKEFYDNLVNENKVDSSFDLAQRTMRDFIKYKNKQVHFFSNLTDARIGPGPILLPDGENHDHTLYGDDGWSSTILSEGKLADMSSVRGPTNIKKCEGVFTSRQFEMFKCAYLLQENQVVNVFGTQGVGKTRFCLELGYFLNVRNEFFSGIFYVSMK